MIIYSKYQNCQDCGKKLKYERIIVRYDTSNGCPIYAYRAVCSNFLGIFRCNEYIINEYNYNK